MLKLNSWILNFVLVLVFVLLTLVTQIGGIILLLTISVARLSPLLSRYKILLFLVLYAICTFLLVPLLAPKFGREKIRNNSGIKPASFFTIVCNRNYVNPIINSALQNTAQLLSSQNDKITIVYLDANLPFYDGFPLLPHLSHNDGKKIDIGLVYETSDGKFSTEQKSRLGYGVFVKPDSTEPNQTNECKNAGYWQYDYSKYFTFGIKNKNNDFSEEGTKQLITTLLLSDKWGKLFIEPHLKQRLNLTDTRVRFHGCGAVRHDDHIHIQLQ